MNKRRRSRLGMLVLLCMAAYFTYVIIEQQGYINAKRFELKAVQEKIQNEKELGEKLAKELDRVNSDEYNEKIAREKLGMVKDGDVVFMDISR